jgi:FtsP/CotA-like multicopper oxidase with cupredoxin domain
MKVNNMKKVLPGSFRLNPVVAALLLVTATQFPANLAHANSGGFATNTDIGGNLVDVPTFFATSPQGIRPAYDKALHRLAVDPVTKIPYLTIDTGKPLRKFVDPLGGAYNGLDNLPGMTDLQSGIPVAIAEKWKNLTTNAQTADDYYEIAVVEYTQQMHSDLPKPTRLRGYVQVETPNLVPKVKTWNDSTPAGLVGQKDVTGLIGSEHIQAFYPDGVTPILNSKGEQVYWVHKPHYLGPVIVVAKGTPVRMKYTNYLPYKKAGANGASVGTLNVQGGQLNGGAISLPVDRFILGGGPAIDSAGNSTEFTQNRASIHWHGGDSPWISDGTPHQWTAPAGEADAWAAGIGKGASFQNVPDMPDPGPGSGTLYFPNNLSGRLMMYHDHTSGLTKLNVYMGEAAGYVVYDGDELTLAANALGTTLSTKVTTGPFTGLPIGLLDSVGIPLVIQDKTFVPKNIGPDGSPVKKADGTLTGEKQSQDTKWDLTHWGQPGDLFFPHVYETNQDPNSADGTNPSGRWDWGPWFWPVFPSEFSLPTGVYGDVTQTPEAFADTMVVNGQAYPFINVDPKTYRFRILSVGNDRSVNLSLFQAVDAAGTVCSPAALAAAGKAAPTPSPVAYGGTTYTDLPATCTEVKMVPAVKTANFPPTWPTDGRPGGVPDPATKGPNIVQIGSEGGLLPAVAVIEPQPVTYDLDKRSITILNVKDRGLFMGGGERADVLIDFSNYAGQTLLVYNDAPTPMPAVDPRTDFYTGMGDMTDAGGSYDPAPGYAPNTRTIMQIKVNTTNTSGTGGALNLAELTTALPVAYAKTQPPPNVPQAAYNVPFGQNWANNFAQIRTGGLSQPYFQMAGTTFAITGLTLTSGGSGYLTPPTVTLTAPPPGPLAKQATATATITNGVVTGLTVDTGAGYFNTQPLKATFSAPVDANGVAIRGGVAATANVEVNAFKVINKAIQELFEPVYGRMNATLAVELPFSSAVVATTIPLAYLDAPIDYMDGIKEGETQVWKITHNGVDSHPVHFHMVNAQVINRVDWAGVIKPTPANELGWKETVMMNPLEDIYVAVRAVKPLTPFGLPKSARTLDPTQVVGSPLGLTQIDPLTGQAPTYQTQLVDPITGLAPTDPAQYVNAVSRDVQTNQYTNQLTDFDNEYVWHCHILGHEENDFMRPFIFHPNVVRPDPVVITSTPGATTIRWTDPTPANTVEVDVNGNIVLDASGNPKITYGVDSQNIPTANIGTTKVRQTATGVSLGSGIITAEPVSNPKNEIGFIVMEGTVNNGTTTYIEKARVIANATSWAGADPAKVYQVLAYNAAGNSTAVSIGQTVGTETATTITTTVPTAAATPAVLTGVSTAPTVAGNTVTWASVANATDYNVYVGGVLIQANATGTSATLAITPTGAVTVVANGATPAAPVDFTFVRTAAGITLTWANSPMNLGNVTGLTLTWTGGSKVFTATSTGATITGLGSTTPSTAFSLVANGTGGNSTAINPTP